MVGFDFAFRRPLNRAAPFGGDARAKPSHFADSLGRYADNLRNLDLASEQFDRRFESWDSLFHASDIQAGLPTVNKQSCGEYPQGNL
jgi:hypothetical protein